jgi:hypothetical protein
MNSTPNKTPPQSGNQSPKRAWEDRPNWASCFPPRNPKSEHPPNFIGVTVIDGKKFWVDIWLKTASNGNPFASVHIKTWEDGQ